MKKNLILILTTFLIFSCSLNNEKKEVLEKTQTGKIEKNIISDEEFINSKENIKNKDDAKFCLSKLKNQDGFKKIYGNSGNNFIIQAFKDKNSGECFYLTFWGNFISGLKKINLKEKKERLNDINDFLTVIYEKIDDIENYYFKNCKHFKHEIEANILNGFDNIFLENNIIPPRIIYTKEDLKNEDFFYIDIRKSGSDEDFKDLKGFDNYLNYYYKYKNSKNYSEIKSFFEKINKFKLKKFLEGEKKDIPSCYSLFDSTDFKIQKILELNPENYTLESIKKEIKEFKKQKIEF